MKFKRILSFSPTLTFDIGRDGNFYQPVRRLTGMSHSVRVEHPCIDVGEQRHLYGIALIAYVQLIEVGADSSDVGINTVIRAAIGHAAKVKAKSVKLLRERDGATEGRPKWTVEGISAMSPDELLNLAIDSRAIARKIVYTQWVTNGGCKLLRGSVNSWFCQEPGVVWTTNTSR